MTNTASWYARTYADRFGFQLVPIEPRRKFPTANDWGHNLLSEPDSAAAFYDDRTDWNMGLALGPSGMCSLDIDCMESFERILSEFGIPTTELDAFPTIQGSSKGKRLLFRVPDGQSLGYHKVNWPKQDDHSKKYTVFELRSVPDGEDKQRQDVLPPSIHPDTGEPYRWLVQPASDRASWPDPPAWLLAIWTSFSAFKPQLEDACPWRPATPRFEQPARKAPVQTDGDSPIDLYLAHNTLPEALTRYGYRQVSGKRWLSPHSSTGLPGVIADPGADRCWICHASDPLCSEDSGQPVNAFDLFCHYEHGGDASAAVKALAKEYGLNTREARRTTPSPASPPELPPEQHEQTEQADQPDPATTSDPFKPLGYNGAQYYYLPRGTEQVCSIRRGGHTSPAEMLSLAPIEWWEARYPKPSGNGCDWQWAASDLMRACEAAGIYSEERERGRGAWFDAGRSVFHLGDSLLVDGHRKAIIEHDSRYIYTKQPAMEHGTVAKPATLAQAQELPALIARLSWAKPVHAELAAGWLALAPICGALSWRPHIWLTAERGAGKSWAQNNLFAPILGPSALVVQGSTSEAGIRQRLRQDARPIVFDEAEAENQAGARRMQSIIELARQASSDSGAEVVKGTSDGTGQAFRARSMFLLGSINVALNQAADESRFSVVQLSKGRMTPAEFDRYAVEVGNTLTAEYCAAIRARAYALIPVIRDNVRTLANAVAETLGSQRIGDQVGTLLAGCYSLRSDGRISEEEAVEWVSRLDLSDAEEAESVSDSDLCLQSIMQSQIRLDGSGAVITRSVGELVEMASTDMPAHAESAREALERHGLKVTRDELIVSNTHGAIKAMLRDTAWGAGWRRVLARLPGAEPMPSPVRFAGSQTRAVSIPLRVVL